MRNTITLAVVVLSVFTLVNSSLGQPLTGTLQSSTNPAGLIGTGAWTPSSITWTVSINQDDSWHYDYVLDVYGKSISHFILETSTNFSSSDIWNEQGPFGKIEVGWQKANSGNPYIPEPIYGIKFDEASGTTVHISFDSGRAPMWGDFYTKDGDSDGIKNTMRNAGFVVDDTDPSAAPANGSIDYHILVPDTVPEPGSFAALAGMLTVSGAALLRRIRR